MHSTPLPTRPAVRPVSLLGPVLALVLAPLVLVAAFALGRALVVPFLFG